MKKKFWTLLLPFLTLAIWAGNFKILQMNTDSVRIGNRICRKYDVFSSDSVIHWSSNKQALKTQNMETKEIQLFAGIDFQKKKVKTIKDYYIKNNRLSTRSVSLSLKDMAESLTDDFYLFDTIRIESSVPVDSSRYFYIMYSNKEKTERKILKNEDGSLVIDRNLFPMADSSSVLKVAILYTKQGVNGDYLLSDSMNIFFIPLVIGQ